MPSLGETVPVVLEENILNFVNVFSIFPYYLPWKRHGPLFEQTWISITQGCFGTIFVEIGPACDPGEEDENVKSLQTDEQSDGRRAIKKAHLIFQLR